MVVLYGNTAVIHPMCAIDEYAMIFEVGFDLALLTLRLKLIIWL